MKNFLVHTVIIITINDIYLIQTQMLTADFAESHVKKRVKKGGSLPSITTNTGVS